MNHRSKWENLNSKAVTIVVVLLPDMTTDLILLYGIKNGNWELILDRASPGKDSNSNDRILCRKRMADKSVQS